MNTVEPIRDMDLVMDLADYLKSNNERDYVLFMFGIYTGLRISDILKCKGERRGLYSREENREGKAFPDKFRVTASYRRIYFREA